MNIAIFTDTFLPQINGVVTATLSLARGLADRGHKVHIIAPKFKKMPKFKYNNITIQLIPGIKAGFYEDFKFTLFLNPKVFKYIHNNSIDVIHFQTPFTLGWESIICSKIFKKPLVGTFHTIFSDPNYLKHAGLTSKTFEKMAWSYAGLFYNRCNTITSPSKTTKRELKQKGFSRPIKVISNGIELDAFDNSSSKEIKKKYNLNGKVLLFVGRIAHEKSIVQLLRIFYELTKEYHDIKLLVVGGGPQEKEIKDKIITLKLKDNVIMVPAMPHKKLIKSGIYGASDLFISASKTETQGITFLEAMANGLPCVGFNKRGVGEVVNHNHNGLLVPPDDEKKFVKSVNKIFKDNELYSKLSKGALKSIKKHDMQYVLEQWEELYNKVTN